MDPVTPDPAPRARPAAPWHHIAASLWEAALLAGVIVRVLHVIFNAHGHELDWHSVVGTFILVPVVLLALATLHLANYPLPQWLWRAPAFAVAEAAAESLTSLALIFTGRERWGTGRAELGDWPAMAASILLTRFVMISLFALVLGAIAQFVRRRELKADRKRSHESFHGPDRRQ